MIAEYERAQASVVRAVYDDYTVKHMSIGEITRKLNDQGVPTATGRQTRWERSTLWGMLRNPAYQGKACYGKTCQQTRRKVTRTLRLNDKVASAQIGGHERPRGEWIEIAVPAIVSEQTFALAAERLALNKAHSARHTKTPSVVQGIVSCDRCGLCALSHIGSLRCPRSQLLPMSGVRFVATSERTGVRLSPGATGFS